MGPSKYQPPFPFFNKDLLTHSFKKTNPIHCGPEFNIYLLKRRNMVCSRNIIVYAQKKEKKKKRKKKKKHDWI